MDEAKSEATLARTNHTSLPKRVFRGARNERRQGHKSAVRRHAKGCRPLMLYRFIQKRSGRPLDVTDVCAEDLADWCAERGFKFTGTRWGHPVFEEFFGPSRDGADIIRYEDWPAFELLGR
jgi:hypothetical protein